MACPPIRRAAGCRARLSPPGRALLRSLIGAGGSALLLVLAACSGEEPAADPLAGLVRAVGQERFTLPWLSAFSEHRGCLETEAGYCADRAGLPRRDLARWAAAQAGSGTEPDATTLHARGVWHLLFPPDGPARAAAALERARELAPGDWRVANDLAAAELLRGLAGEPLRLLDALAAAEAAVEIAPDALPPRFNLALVLERLGLDEDARRAWRRIPSQDLPPGTQPWQDETTSRLSEPERHEPDPAEVSEALRQTLATEDGARLLALVEAAPQDAHRFAEEEILGDWARAVTATDPIEEGRAAGLLAEANRLGEALATVTGDRFVLATARRAGALGPSDRRQLANALLHFADARERYDARELTGARRELREALRAAKGLGSPLVHWIGYYRLLCAYWQQDLDASQDEGLVDRLQALRSELDGAGLPILDGYLLWTAGLVHIEAGRFVTGRRLYRQAVDRFTSTGSLSEVALLHTLLSDVEMRLGDLEHGWSEALAATGRAKDFRKPRYLWAAWDQVARIAALAHHDRAALRFQEAALAAAEQAASPSTLSTAFAARAHARLRLGDRPGALDDLVKARRWAEKITDEAAGRRVEASILLAQSHVRGADDTGAAIERLSLALERYRRIDVPVLYPELLLERSRLFASTGAGGAAEEDLLEALDLLRTQSDHVDSLADRLRLGVAARKAIEALLELQLEPERDHRAIPALSDLAREPLGARAVNLSTATSDPAGTPRLAPVEAVLSVTVLPDRLVLWVARDGGTTYATEPIHSEELRRRLAAVARDPVTADLGWFYDRIVRPLGSHLQGVERLFFALDRGLYNLPVGALLDTASGRHLVEQMAIAIVPTASGLAEPPGRQTPAPPERLALIAAPGAGDPTGSGPSAAAQLDHLPGVEREAELLAALYPETRLLTPPVTSAQLAAAGAWADVLHVAAHAVTNPVEPDSSHLLTGPEPLYARDIRRLRLSARPTVVLAACETAATMSEDSSGVSSLAAAFLDAGAGWVIGSPRPLDDRAAVRFTERLHRELLRGASPDRALRRAQIHFLRSGESPLGEWAAYQAFTH